MGACIVITPVEAETAQTMNVNMNETQKSSKDPMKRLQVILSNLSRKNNHITLSTLTVAPTMFGVIPGSNGALVNQFTPYTEIGMIFETVLGQEIEEKYTFWTNLWRTQGKGSHKYMPFEHYASYIKAGLKLMHEEICQQARNTCIKKGGDAVYGVNICVFATGEHMTRPESLSWKGISLSGTCIKFNRKDNSQEAKDDN